MVIDEPLLIIDTMESWCLHPRGITSTSMRPLPCPPPPPLTHRHTFLPLQLTPTFHWHHNYLATGRDGCIWDTTMQFRKVKKDGSEITSCEFLSDPIKRSLVRLLLIYIFKSLTYCTCDTIIISGKNPITFHLIFV